MAHQFSALRGSRVPPTGPRSSQYAKTFRLLSHVIFPSASTKRGGVGDPQGETGAETAKGSST